jgi:hypothetical protein
MPGMNIRLDRYCRLPTRRQNGWLWHTSFWGCLFAAINTLVAQTPTRQDVVQFIFLQQGLELINGEFFIADDKTDKMRVSEQGCVVMVKYSELTCVIDFNKIFVSSATIDTANGLDIHFDGEGAGVHSEFKLKRAFGYFFSCCKGDQKIF